MSATLAQGIWQRYCSAFVVTTEHIEMPQALTTSNPTRQSTPIPLERVTGVHVLVADADGSTRAVREQQLLAAGHRVSVARTAFEAIVKATCHLPDVILLDSSLSDIATSETVAFLGTCPVTSHIPIVRLTRGRAVSQRVLGELRRRSK
jgi:CheY-like chemotaxis protein